MRLILGLLLVAFCFGWTVWWGVLLARRGRWALACLLWLLAVALILEVKVQHEMATRPRLAPPPEDSPDHATQDR